MKSEMKRPTLALPLIFGILLSFSWFSIQFVSGYIKIISPHMGQRVPLGNIVITGTSASNATLHCLVSVVLNGIQPYRNATPLGQHEAGANGYSNWTFTGHISKPGLNRVTAKFSCPPPMFLIKFYSVNVTAAAMNAGAKNLDFE